MSEVTAGIITHPARRSMTSQLVTEVSQWYPTTVYEDDTRLGCTANHLRAWDHLSGARTPWVMVLEDDAVPVPELGYHLGRALYYSPAPIVSLYLGTGRPQFVQPKASRAVKMDNPWIVYTRLLHCVAVCVRSELAADMARGARRAHQEVGKPIDEAITEWARARLLPVAYTNPSLVEHADQAKIADHDWPDPAPLPRVAHRFGTPESWSGQFTLM